MAPHSGTLAWKTPWTEKPGKAAVHEVAKSRTRLSDFPFTFHFPALEKEMATHASVLAWRIPGTGSLVGCRLLGSRLKWLSSSSRRARTHSLTPSQQTVSCLFLLYLFIWWFKPVAQVKNPSASSADVGFTSGSERSPSGGNGYPLQ